MPDAEPSSYLIQNHDDVHNIVIGPADERTGREIQDADRSEYTW